MVYIYEKYFKEKSDYHLQNIYNIKTMVRNIKQRTWKKLYLCNCYSTNDGDNVDSCILLLCVSM